MIEAYLEFASSPVVDFNPPPCDLLALRLSWCLDNLGFHFIFSLHNLVLLSSL